MRVTEHLYVYLWSDQKENNCNSVFIDGKVPLLIDPGHLHRTNQLFGRMHADGADPARIKVVIATHGHPDHLEGASAVGDDAVKVAMSREEEDYLEKTVSPVYKARGMDMIKYRTDFYLKEGDLTLGKHEFQVIATPGHTPGGISLYWPRFKVLISGDIVFFQGVGRSDLPGGDAAVLKQSVEKLATLSVELLIPGHGPALQGVERIRGNFDLIRRLYLAQ
jgi:hydroxyacylglutathione hydrolase